MQKELGMKEGFDVGLEMSGNPQRAPRHDRQHVPTAARSPCSAFPTGEMAIDWNKVIFNMLTIKGIYGREMYETWYKMTVDAPVRPRYRAGHHPPLALSANSRRASSRCWRASPARSSCSWD